jgi:VWFA-related protein
VEENGQPQTIAAFESADSVVAVGLLVDGSQSMYTKLPEVSAAAGAFVRGSDPRDELFIVNFNEHVHLTLPDTAMTATSPAALADVLLHPVAAGKTALYDAVAAALDHIRKSPIERKVLLVISDGGDNASRMTQRELLADISRSEVEIYTIGLFDEDDSDGNPGALRRIAQASGGEAFQPKPGEAVRICQQIAADIRTQYVLAYSPKNQTFCGEYRAIRAHATTDRGMRLTARTRVGYTASPASGEGCR